MAFSCPLSAPAAPSTRVRMRDAFALFPRLSREFYPQKRRIDYVNRSFLPPVPTQTVLKHQGFSASVHAPTHDGPTFRTLPTLGTTPEQAHSFPRDRTTKGATVTGSALNACSQRVTWWADRRGCSSASSVNVDRREGQKPLQQDVRGKPTAQALFANAYPETPLHFYRATRYSEASINHRMFYVNLIFLLFAWDLGSAILDI